MAGLGPAAAAGARGRRAPGAGPARPRRRRRRRRAVAAAGGPATRAVALCSPNDPTGGTIDAARLRRLAGALPAGAWILLDAALADFEEPEADLAGLTGELSACSSFRSFSKAHAMAGFRAGYAIGPDGAASCSAASRRRSALGARRRRGWPGPPPTASATCRAAASSPRPSASTSPPAWRAPTSPSRPAPARCCGSRARRCPAGSSPPGWRQADLRRARRRLGRRPPRPDRPARPRRRPTGSRGARLKDLNRQRRSVEAWRCSAPTRNAPRMNGCTRQKYV